ncbi:hypothetical protein TTHERM_00494890 (macronuclear) [Tetrahymena thermophila SB210]|uniref:Uncharacterized protein n=1 Tax=Tetrahymena thermophila (strain SB210) TaxID=312017 RepID=I7LWX3_TETTS|nr:hypothetical protein TTHERM_00494890 [Tetrahymena thermophila SB210]EAS03027.2 hypothetical protein TTHERM_00494890 [Tetrahymena thermophila SB210]|eukprot:XP_001023272.2 hypothetical protein TTHERM_00494890 [Tetrahymena thermophila SB210]
MCQILRLDIIQMRWVNRISDENILKLEMFEIANKNTCNKIGHFLIKISQLHNGYLLQLLFQCKILSYHIKIAASWLKNFDIHYDFNLKNQT